MTQFLPSNLLSLFAPRDPIPYLPPVDQLPYEKQNAGYTGLAAFVQNFEDPAKTPDPVKIETREERQERRRKIKAEQVAYKLEQDIALWQPNTNPLATSDPFKTLFVARINYDSSESKLMREFAIYGPIRKVVIVTDRIKPNNPSRGYAFIEYEHERDMHAAFKHADGKKIGGRRVIVDVERGRIVKGWLPRRLGGGLGGTRKGGPEVNIKHSGREEAVPDSRYSGSGSGGGGGMKDRAMDRDRERPERPERRRSRSRERRRRSRSRSRDRHRSDRRSKRDKSRDRSDRGRDRDAGSAVVKTDADAMGEGGGPEPEPPRKERRRSRSRDRERKHRRSRSRDRKRRDHDRDRDRDRDRESRRERGGAMERSNERPEDEVSQPPEPTAETFNNSGYEGDYNNFNNNGETNTFEDY